MDNKTLDYMKERVKKSESLICRINDTKKALEIIQYADESKAGINVYLRKEFQYSGDSRTISDGSSGLIPCRDMFKALKQPLIDFFENRIVELQKELDQI